MKFTRTLACLTASLVGAAGLAIATNAPASAQHHRFTVLGPSPYASGMRSIEGHVVDQGGVRVQNANVKLFKATNDSTTPDASALTYPGYFKFVRLTRGHYTAIISKRGYVTTTVEDITIGPANPHLKLGELLLQKKLEDSTTKVTLAKDSIKVGDAAKGTVKVTTEGAPATGKWKLYLDGDKIDSGKLAKGDGGKFSFSVNGLSKGTHKFSASYDGNIYVKDSDSNKASIDVVKKKR